MTEEYERLAHAVILQAVKDWRASAERLKEKMDDDAAWRTKRECTRFFHSRWFGVLTQIDGAMLLKKLEKEAENHGR